MFKNKTLKTALRKIFPLSVRHFLWTLKPEVSKVNTLVIKLSNVNRKDIIVPDKYSIKQIHWQDELQLKTFYEYTGPSSFQRKVPKRLNSERCKGFAIFDESTGKIVYVNWVIHDFNNYLKEFPINIMEPHLFWDSSFCLPQHRHQGLHARMEQELFRYSELSGVQYFYMQIHADNTKGNVYALSNGYELIDESYIISWPIFDIYRNYNSFLKNPFKKIVF